ncbi:type III pantothenate kinase [Flavobacterium dankookense]|uniref:Type III pantothenate kinase n=1 Tax=Flavobacterium dankookense TaxID=706186 RepID=A0A4R6Q8T3_9FLAO|nr:type III pantothenate kinase [Flavobacterium dankookense]TDP58671.1 type III pantothenate kinase [Flavobacterium dankookense]
MLLAIDVGNTRIKTAVFEQNTFVDYSVFTKKEFNEKVSFILNQYPKISSIVVASVGNLDKNDFLAFENKAKILFINNEVKFPFTNLYETPNTLGIDRMVLATGAVLQFPMQNRLVIDAGTCITYDFIDENDNYLGGAISPGIRLRYESLHQFTAKLPLLTKTNPKSCIGNSTNESIHSGVVNGLTNEIDGFIDYYKSLNANFIIILTGGDAEFLAMRLKNTIFANSNFLLESLNQTFQYNQND